MFTYYNIRTLDSTERGFVPAEMEISLEDSKLFESIVPPDRTAMESSTMSKNATDSIDHLY